MLTKRAYHPASRLLLLGMFVLLLSACAGRTAHRQAEEDLAASGASWAENQGSAARSAYPDRMPPLDEDELDDYAGAPLQAIADPLESWNRFWFGFNDAFYTYFFRPLYKAYAFVTPRELRAGLKNALANALFPVRFVNSILQGKFLAAGVELGRFVVNSTLGIGGLINVTKDRKTIVPVDPDGEDFGQTLGVWGVGPGIYLVWPVIGPSNARDTVGRAADWLMDPLLFVPGTTTVNIVSAGIWGGLRVNAADDTLETYEDIKKAAVDPYISMRDIYTRYRQNRIAR
ncbi:MAG: VacJ family lipoprotein [Desulfovibrionaceae bacterium]|nr:VacJ family lipoprotein [Desulfovibrionaceae bacterium]